MVGTNLDFFNVIEDEELSPPSYVNNNFNTTILISTYKNVDYIEECLDSIENQTFYKNEKNKFQVLVGVDGCPETFKKIIEIKDKYRNLDVFNLEKNMGAYVALNTLIPHIKYDNIIVFGSDDVMMPTGIEALSKTDPKYDIVKFKYKVFVDNIENVVSNATAQAAGAIMIKKHVFDMCGGYHHNRFSCDYELLVRLSKFTTTLPINDYIFYYRAHQKSLTTLINKQERIAFDNMIRRTTYGRHNLKINPVVNKIIERCDTFK